MNSQHFLSFSYSAIKYLINTTFAKRSDIFQNSLTEVIKSAVDKTVNRKSKKTLIYRT